MAPIGAGRHQTGFTFRLRRTYHRMVYMSSQMRHELSRGGSRSSACWPQLHRSGSRCAARPTCRILQFAGRTPLPASLPISGDPRPAPLRGREMNLFFVRRSGEKASCDNYGPARGARVGWRAEVRHQRAERPELPRVGRPSEFPPGRRRASRGSGSGPTAQGPGQAPCRQGRSSGFPSFESRGHACHAYAGLFVTCHL